MKILVDADACPVIPIIEELAKEYKIPCILLCDTNHILHSEYSEIVVIGAGKDAVDFALINRCSPSDLVVSQDYGVGALALSKRAYGIHPSGKWYTSEAIDSMLMERHLAKMQRMSKQKYHSKGPSKRTKEDNERFRNSFRQLIQTIQGKEN